MNKIEISNPIISLINCLVTPPNYPSKNTPAITDSCENIHLAKKATTKMALVIISSDITERLPYGSTMELPHILTLHIPGINKQAIQIHITPEIKTAPPISLRVLCDNGCTITIDKQ